MKTPMVVSYIYWDIVCKCKNLDYKTEEECLKSIWVEEYANRIEDYNTDGMIRILGQAIEEVVPERERAFLLDRLLRAGWINKENMLHLLWCCLADLTARDKNCYGRYEDLYIIECKGKYYTIAQYDKLKEM